MQIIRQGLLPAFLRHNVAAGVEHRVVLAPLNCRHVVDVGANRGQFALIVRKCFPEAMIDSFEPLKEPADRFQALFDNDQFTQLHRLAIGLNEGEAEIHVSSRDDSSSLLPITDTQSMLFPGTAEHETRMIQVAPLKNIIPEQDVQEPALLKIDVQGFELEVLRGCEELLEQFQYIYVECSFVELYAGQAFADEVIAFLRERNFILEGVYNPCYDKNGRAVQADFFFVAQESNV
ncbi:MAG: FkbM family methyltransferase [Gammaproteobacteria bacterium]|nr:FkbM family methyltransferase [Gammaproteobacteria bacterium]